MRRVSNIPPGGPLGLPPPGGRSAKHGTHKKQKEIEQRPLGLDILPSDTAQSLDLDNLPATPPQCSKTPPVASLSTPAEAASPPVGPTPLKSRPVYPETPGKWVMVGLQQGRKRRDPERTPSPPPWHRLKPSTPGWWIGQRMK